jgi:hypothetical protein
MIPMHELKAGDIVNAEFEGALFPGSVVEFDHGSHQVCVITNDDQESWFSPEDLFPITLTKETLENLQFRQDGAPAPDGSVTYVRGPFSIVIADPSVFQNLTLHYRSEAPRVLHHGLAMHELQNHYLDMTNVHLVDRADLEH